MNNNYKKPENARRIAYNALLSYSKGAYSNLAINDELKKTKAMEQRDRAFASTLFYSCIEQLITLDYHISLYAKKRVQLPVKCVLRIAICEMLYLDVADHAAINESVELCKEIGKEQSGGFVNAVLRNVAKNKHDKKETYGDEIDRDEIDRDEIDRISIEHSYPRELLEIFIDDYSLEKTMQIIEYNKTAARFCIRANEVLFSTDELIKYLEDKEIYYERGFWNTNAFYVEKAEQILSSSLYDEGKIAIQGESSMVVGEIAAKSGGQKILDVCAAPGGKTAYIAQRLKNSRIDAWDIHEHRVGLIKKNCARLGINNVRACLRDSSAYDADLKESYDMVLVDAPCTGSGVIQKKPDIKYSISKNSLEELTKLQNEILWNCSKFVKLGGYLIYSTCSVFSQENEEQVRQFLNINDKFALDEIDSDLTGKQLEAKLSKGELKFFSPRDNIDGFYIAKMKRVR